MSNYNYRSNDYMRRNQCRTSATVTPARVEREFTSSATKASGECCMHDTLRGMPIAMAYVPWQEWKNLYPAEKALHRGTIFEELDKPFEGKGGCC